MLEILDRNFDMESGNRDEEDVFRRIKAEKNLIYEETYNNLRGYEGEIRSLGSRYEKELGLKIKLRKMKKYRSREWDGFSL